MLDIEKLGRQRARQQRDNRGGDIDEDLPNDISPQKGNDKRGIDDSIVDQHYGLNSSAPYMLSNSSTESFYDKLYQFNMVLIASILLGVMLTFVSMSSIPPITLVSQSQGNAIKFLPFYTSGSVLAISIFAVIGLFMIIKNFVNYIRFGISC